MLGRNGARVRQRITAWMARSAAAKERKSLNHRPCITVASRRGPVTSMGASSTRSPSASAMGVRRMPGRRLTSRGRTANSVRIRVKPSGTTTPAFQVMHPTATTLPSRKKTTRQSTTPTRHATHARALAPPRQSRTRHLGGQTVTRCQGYPSQHPSRLLSSFHRTGDGVAQFARPLSHASPAALIPKPYFR